VLLPFEAVVEGQRRSREIAILPFNEAIAETLFGRFSISIQENLLMAHPAAAT
jgi:hypothetical protein